MNASAHLVTLLMLGHMHLVAQVLSPVMSSIYMCVSRWVHVSHSILRSVLHHPHPLSFLACTSSSTLSSTTWSPCKTCSPPRTRGVTTPTTSPCPSQVMSPTSWPSASSTTVQVPSPTLPSHRTWTLTTLHFGKLLDEAHRGQADYCDPEGVSVFQSSSVVFFWEGKPAGERDDDQSIGFGVMRNTYSALSNFSEITQAEKMVDRTGKPVGESSSKAQMRTILDEQRQMNIAEYCERIGQHELQAAHAEEERQILREEFGDSKWLSWSSSTKSYRDGGIAKIAKFFSQYARKTEAHREWGRVQDLQNEVTCMNDFEDFQDAESVRSGNSHVTSRWRFPSYRRAAKKVRYAFGRHGISGNWQIHLHLHQIFILKNWINGVRQLEEPLNTSTGEKSERPEQNRHLRCQAGPSAKDSVIFSGGDSSKNFAADQQRLQISDLHFDKFPTPATFACWMKRFKTEACTCSQLPTKAMQWIKEVELVDSVDELRSSSSVLGISMPNFEVLDARIASALNKIIHNSLFRRRISLEDRFFRGRQIAYLIYDHFRVTGWHDSVKNYTDLFTIVPRNDDIQEFDSKWDGILLSVTKIPHDDILEGGLYTLRIRESKKFQTVLELFDLEMHQKKLGPDYHRLKTMVKRSIEQEKRH